MYLEAFFEDGVDHEALVHAPRASGFRFKSSVIFPLQTLTNDNGLALFMPVPVGHMLPDAPALSGTWRVLYEHPLSAGLAMYAQANDHYVSAEHPYLGDPTTFGRGHDLGARLGVKNPVQHWDTSLWVTNLTDTRPLTYAFAGSEGQQVSFYQKPRDVGINVTYTF